jgi:hypothetical protein
MHQVAAQLAGLLANRQVAIKKEAGVLAAVFVNVKRVQCIQPPARVAGMRPLSPFSRETIAPSIVKRVISREIPVAQAPVDRAGNTDDPNHCKPR